MQGSIDSVDNSTIEGLLRNLETEKQSLRNRQKYIQVKLATSSKSASETKNAHLNTELDLIGQNIILIERLTSVYSDKMALKKRNQLLSTMVSTLLTQCYDMSCEFTQKMHQLVSYQQSLPNEREIQLKMDNDQLKLKL